MIELYQYFYHMTHRANLPGILQAGILSDHLIRQNNVQIADISDPEVQRWRDFLEPVFGRSIHSYASLYLNPRNPMLYCRVAIQQDILILAISTDVLRDHDHVFTDGNAASRYTSFAGDANIVNNAHEVLLADYWTDFEDGKRRKCAEVLVYPQVEPEYIDHIVCLNGLVRQTVVNLTGIPTRVDPCFYF